MADVRNLMMLRSIRGRSGHLVFGVGLVLMGYALLVIALAEQAQRAAAATVRAAAIESIASAQASAPREPSPATTATTPPPMTTPAATTAPVASVVPVATDPALDADARLFKFSPGGAVMARDEVQRLLALGKVIAHRPGAKVSVEGFGDLPGSEPLMVGIAKHRAKVAQTLLAKAGLTEDRVSIAFVDMGPEARLARSIRITTTPPLSEIEKP
jgi:outer membrane protein OmpA-like peptidoglycan-associated protein